MKKFMKEYLYNGLRAFALAMILPLTLVSGACEVRLPKTNPEPTCKTSEGQEYDCVMNLPQSLMKSSVGTFLGVALATPSQSNFLKRLRESLCATSILA